MTVPALLLGFPKAMSVKQDLFGGAIVTEAPTGLIDASDLRQVPDTQEVFMYSQSGISIIVEILQSVEETDSIEAVKFHFDSLAHDNSAQQSEVLSTNILCEAQKDTPAPILLEGLQTVAKFNRRTPDRVAIFMALYRIENKNTDVVVTFNVPVQSEDGGAVDEPGLARARQEFETFSRSLRIVDYSLFA